MGSHEKVLKKTARTGFLGGAVDQAAEKDSAQGQEVAAASTIGSYRLGCPKQPPKDGHPFFSMLLTCFKFLKAVFFGANDWECHVLVKDMTP